MRKIKIKFKAKQLNSGEWFYGDLVHLGNRVCIGGDNIKDGITDVAPSTICQFTGLTDCEGNEVWEGDIIGNHDFPFERRTVTWANCLSCFIPIDEDGGQDRHLSWSCLKNGLLLATNSIRRSSV